MHISRVLLHRHSVVEVFERSNYPITCIEVQHMYTGWQCRENDCALYALINCINILSNSEDNCHDCMTNHLRSCVSSGIYRPFPLLVSMLKVLPHCRIGTLSHCHIVTLPQVKTNVVIPTNSLKDLDGEFSRTIYLLATLAIGMMSLYLIHYRTDTQSN